MGSAHGGAALHQGCFQWDKEVQVIWGNQMRLSVFPCSQLHAEGHVYGLGCLQYSGAQMNTALLIFQSFLPSSGGFSYSLSISYNLGLLMDKDVVASHHQKLLCQISLTETVFSATEIRLINVPC